MHSDLDATKTLLEAALREKAAADALLRTEQGHVGKPPSVRSRQGRGDEVPSDSFHAVYYLISMSPVILFCSSTSCPHLHPYAWHFAAVHAPAHTCFALAKKTAKIAALEKEVERLRESAAAQSQKLLDAVSEVERAKRGASSARSEAMAEGKAAALKEASVARKEDAARLRREMETALAEVCRMCTILQLSTAKLASLAGGGVKRVVDEGSASNSEREVFSSSHFTPYAQPCLSGIFFCKRHLCNKRS